MKKIFVVTSTRADYGLLKPVIKKLKNHKKVQLGVIVTGTHLKAEYGNTIQEIIEDGVNPTYQIDILKYRNDNIGVAKTIAYTVETFTDLFSKDTPDLVLVLGDRYEIFAVCTAAAALSIPIAHISGGDVTVGAKDDFYRHCITQMSNLHFASCQQSYERLLRLGQQPNTVYNVGGLGNENIKNVTLMSKQQLEESLNFHNITPFFLITYHPETQKKGGVEQDMNHLLKALEELEGYNLIFTKSNADAGGEKINEIIDDFCAKHHNRARAFFSLGLTRYLSAMNNAQAVVGNSSSGVVESPSFKVPCVNIGDRQKGRPLAENIICTTTQQDDILNALKTAVSPQFIQKCETAKSPYDNGCVPSEKIVETLLCYLEHTNSTIKIFYDGEV